MIELRPYKELGGAQHAPPFFLRRLLQSQADALGSA